VLRLSPSLPEELDGLDFDVRYRGNWGINLHLTRTDCGSACPSPAPPRVRIGVKGEAIELAPGSTREFRL
jgi:trehalose/maltose hydrolase-like predicted phosphorylase